MKAKSFTYGRTVSKDYQSRKLEVAFDLDEGESLDEAIAQAKIDVDAKLEVLDAPAPKNVAPRFKG